ncbi:MAG: cobalamin biosynthesis protein [Lachnospiraceae bacterium]|nr:cobalamin biosynthesis protein [Lachnospiraceae bacterium]
MKKAAICFTKDGKALIERINEKLTKAGLERAQAYISMGEDSDCEGFESVKESLIDWTKKQFEEHNAVIFVGAMGIAVRAISSFAKDKLSDSPVIVIDDLGRYVIPVIGGHAGGANKLATVISKLIDAQAVITTSTDSHAAFSADVFAKENSLKICNREGIKKVSAKAIEGKPVTISIKDYPPDKKVDIIVANETDKEYDLLLMPKRYTVGIGMKKGLDKKTAEEFLFDVLKANDIDISDVYAFASIDVKEDEEALNYLKDRYSIPLITFDAGLLNRLKGEFDSSEFVKKTVGVDNVCERAAVLAAGTNSELIVGKQAGNGMTVAVAKRF